MTKPVMEQLWGGPCDGGTLVPTANTIDVSFEIFVRPNTPEKDKVPWIELAPMGRYSARYVFDGVRFVYDRRYKTKVQK